MFKWLPCCSSKPEGKTGSPPIEQALQANAVAVISMACCMPGSESADDATIAAVTQGMQTLGEPTTPVVVSATDAQKLAMGVPAHYDEASRRVVEQVMALFTQHGMGVFPVVIIDRQIAFYGGSPTADQVVSRVQELRNRRMVA